MVIRGAPAIGVAGALALAVDLTQNKASGTAFSSTAEALHYIKDTLAYLVTRYACGECV
jgi:methylthioribose-1-phosphate isomerase